MAKKVMLVDTNIIVRYLIHDNEKMYAESVEWFSRGEKGEFKLSIPALVIAEACFVLESFYKRSKKDVGEAMEVLISQKWLDIKNRETLLDCMAKYKNGIHFVDAYLQALSRSAGADILTFDKKIKAGNK